MPLTKAAARINKATRAEKDARKYLCVTTDQTVWKVNEVFLFAALAILACNSDDDQATPPIVVQAPAAQLTIVTGLDLKDFNGAELGVLGTPNIYGEAVVYPNPAVNTILVQVGAGSTLLQKIWLVSASKRDTAFTASEVTEAMMDFAGYAADSLAAGSIRLIEPGSPSAVVNLEVGSLEAGFYRVILEDVSGVQHGTSIFIDPNSRYPMILDDLIASW